MKHTLIMIRASFCCLLVLGFAPYACAEEASKRLVFFDVQVDERLGQLKDSVPQLTTSMENALVSVRGLTVTSQSVRNTLILQRKMKLEDCAKAECRFAMVKSLSIFDLMLVAEVSPLEDSCTVSMKVSSMKDGAVLSSRFVESKCEVRALMGTLSTVSRGIWPPTDSGTSDAASDILLSIGGNLKLQDVSALPGEFRGGGSLNLDIDADVLVAYDAAVIADRAGKDRPAQAVEAWRELSAIKGENPYREEAVKRAAEWQEIVDKRAAFQQQKKLDTVRMRKVMPLSTVPDTSKKQLVAKFAGLYGADEAINIISSLSGKLKTDLCAAYFEKGANVSLSVSAIDESGKPVVAAVEIDGRKFGNTPLAVRVPSCAGYVALTAHEKDPWRQNLSLANSGGSEVVQAPLVTNAAARQKSQRKETAVSALAVTGGVLSGVGLFVAGTSAMVGWISRTQYEIRGKSQTEYDDARDNIQTANKILYVGYGSTAGGLALLGVSWAIK